MAEDLRLGKRRRLDEWVRLDPKDCLSVQDSQRVVFVDGFFDDFPSDDRQEKWNRPESAKPLCTQYIEWLFPEQRVEASANYQKYIDLRELDGVIYMFRAPGFFFFSNPHHLAEGDLFYRQYYDIDFCMEHGAYDSTTMQIIAFYYTKILPYRFRKNVYIHKDPINVPFFEEPPRRAECFRSLLCLRLKGFIEATPRGSMGIVLAGYPDHAMLLIYDSKKNRIELYEPNGVHAKYHKGEDASGPLQSVTFYDYLKTHVNGMLRGMGITRIWGNTLGFQQKDNSCSLWASAMAICRMTGISRAQLPTKTQDVKDITSRVRTILWDVCLFHTLEDGVVPFKDIDTMLNVCQVPDDQAKELLGMVTKFADYSPIPIPPDELLGDDMKGDSSDESLGEERDHPDELLGEEMKGNPPNEFMGDAAKDEGCPSPLVIDLQQVHVTKDFVDNLGLYCEDRDVTVRGTSLGESTSALRLILTWARFVRLEMSELINLTDVDTVRNIQLLVNANRKTRFQVDEAVMYAVTDAIQVFRDMRARLHFDKVILTREVTGKYSHYLRDIADDLEYQDIPWRLTFNLLNTEAMEDVFKLPHDSVDRIVCTGPLVGEEPPNFLLNNLAVNRLTLLMNRSACVQVPSADMEVVEDACRHATESTTHITEVGAYPTADDYTRAISLFDYIQKGQLKIDRLVLKLTVPIFDPNSLSEFAGAFERTLPDSPVYLLLDPIDESTMQAARALNVSKFIVSNRLGEKGYTPEHARLVSGFLYRAKDVVYRAIQS